MISIITPTYNSEKYLEACIISIKNQINNNFEHIIIDGGSKDQTVKIIQKYEGTYPMRWISEKDNGMYDAVSKGFSMATGDIFCWLNSDDIYMPWATMVMETIVRKNNISWCSGYPSHLSADGIGFQHARFRTSFSRKCIEKGYMRSGMMGSIQQESCFWTRDLWEKSGGLNSQYKLAGDFHLWKNFAQYEQLYVVNSVIASFRIHEGQKSSDRESYSAECGKLSFGENIKAKLKFFKILNRITQITNKKFVINIAELEIKGKI